MTKIKKILPYICIFIVCFVIGWFTVNNDTEIANNTLNIVTTFYPVDLIVDNIVENVGNIEVNNITKEVGGCVHEYSMNPKDMKAIEKADLIVINGMGLEPFMSSVDTSNLNVLDSTYEFKSEATFDHVWMNPDLYMKQIKAVLNALIQVDSANSDNYTANANAYIAKVNDIKANIENMENTDVNIALMQDSFEYFANIGKFNISAKLYSAHDEGVSANDMKNFVQNIKDTNTKVILIDSETYEENEDLVKTIENEVDVKFYVLDLIVEDRDNINQYIDSMNSNIEILKDAIEYARS